MPRRPLHSSGNPVCEAPLCTSQAYSWGEGGSVRPGRFGCHAAACTTLCSGPSCSHLHCGFRVIPLHGVRGMSKPAMARWGGRMGQLILIILYINNFRIVCKFGNSCRRSNVTLLLLPHSSGCLSHSLVFLYLKLDCKWSGKGPGLPLPLSGPAGSYRSRNK